MPPDDALSGKPCKDCTAHAGVHATVNKVCKEQEKQEKDIKGKVAMTTFRWIVGGLFIGAILILGFTYRTSERVHAVAKDMAVMQQAQNDGFEDLKELLK